NGGDWNTRCARRDDEPGSALAHRRRRVEDGGLWCRGRWDRCACCSALSSAVFVVGDLGPAPFFYSTSIVAAVSFAASVLPAWRASALSPMVAIRNDMASMWHLPTLMVRRAVQRTVVPLGILISEFAGSIRRAESFPEAIQISLETLRERVGAQSIMLLDQGALPAQGILLKRLKHYPHPLTLAPSDFET